MEYSDGHHAKLGDYVIIARKYKGIVAANMDDDEYSLEHPKEQWGYLQKGVMIDTDFGGLVHYQQDSIEGELIELDRRA